VLPFGLSWTETVVIFMLALLLFGPKKLPELGRTVAKALGEFRRASSELRYTWDQQMRELEKDTAEIKQVSNEAANEIYSYNYDSSYDESQAYYENYGSSDASEPAATSTESSTDGASAVLGASDSLPPTAESYPDPDSAGVKTAEA
jgi:TatA/E family protein of Tat protein translocase